MASSRWGGLPATGYAQLCFQAPLPLLQIWVVGDHFIEVTKVPRSEKMIAPKKSGRLNWTLWERGRFGLVYLVSSFGPIWSFRRVCCAPFPLLLCCCKQLPSLNRHSRHPKESSLNQGGCSLSQCHDANSLMRSVCDERKWWRIPCQTAHLLICCWEILLLHHNARFCCLNWVVMSDGIQLMSKEIPIFRPTSPILYSFWVDSISYRWFVEICIRFRSTTLWVIAKLRIV